MPYKSRAYEAWYLYLSNEIKGLEEGLRVLSTRTVLDHYCMDDQAHLPGRPAKVVEGK